MLHTLSNSTPESKDYNLFFEFVEKFAPSGFQGINRADPLMQEIEEMTDQYDQFFFAGDLIKMAVTFTSNRSYRMIGIEPENVTPYHFFEATHPDDIDRHNLGRTHLFKKGQDLYIAKEGKELISTNLRLRNPAGAYTNMLFQCYYFYYPLPFNTVFVIQVHTNIDRFKTIYEKNHYYSGNDLANFRYPDDQLLKTRAIFSAREFDIIKMIRDGFESEQIAQTLFLSIQTVQTHRKNILSKSGMTRMADVITALERSGLL
jgi:DNA-binding CsgD family transcriptional regulator